MSARPQRYLAGVMASALAALKASLQAAGSFAAVQDAATAALPALQRATAQQLDSSELAEVATLHGGEWIRVTLQ